MTVFGTPGGTPLNYTGFQGTQPGNPVQATLSPVNPGVGLLPPNSDNRSGDTILASVSRGTCPANVDITNVGTRDSRPGRTVHESMSAACSDGAGSGFTTVFGGSLNMDASGGNSFGAGGLNQSTSPGGGEGNILPANADVKVVTIPALPQYQG
jgi:hypothetical protein